jgi:hypothetical protein
MSRTAIASIWNLHIVVLDCHRTPDCLLNSLVEKRFFSNS